MMALMPSTHPELVHSLANLSYTLSPAPPQASLSPLDELSSAPYPAYVAESRPTQGPSSSFKVMLPRGWVSVTVDSAYLPFMKPWVCSPTLPKPGTVLHTRNPSTIQDAEAGQSEVQRHPGRLHSEFIQGQPGLCETLSQTNQNQICLCSGILPCQ